MNRTDRKNLPDWLQDVELDRIVSGDAKLIYEHCGEDVLLELAQKLSGMHLYISKNVLIDAKKEYIKRNFTGNNHKQLAIKLNVSEKFVRNVLNEDDRRKREEPGLFDSNL